MSSRRCPTRDECVAFRHSSARVSHGMSDISDPTGQGETFTEPGADRPPTAEEEAAAERHADDADPDEVAEHYDEAIKTGAAVEGEGQIEP